MQYMLLIFEDEAIMNDNIQKVGFEAYMAPWMEYTEAMKSAGVMLSGEPLESAASATKVKVRDGKRIVEDGPFIDAKEQLGGFYVMEVPDLDTAIEWAEKCPASATGTIELRPIPNFGG